MDFVNKSNGHENGWSSEDHQLFLKFRKKCKNVDDLAINLNKLLPGSVNSNQWYIGKTLYFTDISINAVKEHDKWFRKYLLLKNKKEEILQKWRESKNENIEHRDVDSVDVNENMCKSRSYLKTKDENVQEQIALWKVGYNMIYFVTEYSLKVKKMGRFSCGKKLTNNNNFYSIRKKKKKNVDKKGLLKKLEKKKEIVLKKKRNIFTTK